MNGLEALENQAAHVLDGLIPTVEYVVPYLGEVDFTPFILGAVMFAGSYLVLWLLRGVVLSRLEGILRRTKAEPLAVLVAGVRTISHGIYVLVSVYLSLLFFSLPVWLDVTVTALLLFAVAWQGIRIVTDVIEHVVTTYMEKRTDEHGMVDPNAAMMSNLITLASKILLWVFGGIFILSNLGIEVTSLIAGLGIGGIAIAFALQGVLSDLFASFSIYFDKPFRIGDFIIIGDDMGVVEKIGIKSTRIRTLQGEELVVSNNELVNARVQNFKKMRERRVVYTFGITYETAPEKVKRVDGIVKDIFDNLDGARLDRVHLFEFGDFALQFELVFFITSADYNHYMDIRQDFNFQLMDRFSAEGIQFAYPTQTIYTRSS